MERHEQVQRLKQAALEDEKTKAQMSGMGESATPAAALTTANAAEKPTPPVASLSETPRTQISNATLQSRLADLQKTMEVAAL